MIGQAHDSIRHEMENADSLISTRRFGNHSYLFEIRMLGNLPYALLCKHNVISYYYEKNKKTHHRFYQIVCRKY